jgi:type I restriction enzyme, S subunit
MRDESRAFEDVDRQWTRVSLGEVCTILSGGTPPKSEAKYWSGDIPWVSGKDMKAPLLRDTIDHISEAALGAGTRMAPAGSVFLLVRGMGLAKDLPVAVAGREMAFNQDIKALVPHDSNLGPYLRAAIYHRRDQLLSRIVPSAHGTMTLNLDDVQRFEIPMPPGVQEALHIGRVLEMIREKQQLEASEGRLAKSLKTSVMRELFTRGLRGEAQKETEFGQVPESWSEVSLAHCATVQTGATKGRRFAADAAIELPYLRVANVQDGHLDLSEMKTLRIHNSEVDRYRLRPGDVVLTEGGDFDKLGRGFIWRGELDLCIHQNHVFAVRPHRDKLLPEFFAYLAQSPYGKAYFLKVAHKTTNLACINSTKLKAFPVLIPTVDEQRDIVAILDAIDQKIDLHRRKRAVLDDLFKALLHKLMTGEIRVADLDLSVLKSTTSAEAAA